jgi:hypothetical protein
VIISDHEDGIRQVSLHALWELKFTHIRKSIELTFQTKEWRMSDGNDPFSVHFSSIGQSCSSLTFCATFVDFWKEEVEEEYSPRQRELESCNNSGMPMHAFEINEKIPLRNQLSIANIKIAKSSC